MDSTQIIKVSELSSASKRASYFASLLKKEMEVCNRFLSEDECKILRRYYRSFVNISERRLIFEQYIYTQRVSPLLNAINHSTTKVKILDAGCGFGSESILCGMLGAEVTGIDLKEERLAIANKRLFFYTNKLARPISVVFCLGSVFDLTDTFDVIYAKLSISHIAPAFEFIAFAYEHLNQGGKLIIADDNALNPYMYLWSKKAQWERGGSYIKKKNPKTGEMVSYAQERIFTIPSIKRMLTRNNFRIEEMRAYGFCPYTSLAFGPKDISYYIEHLFSQMPVVRMFGACYTVSTRKN